MKISGIYTITNKTTNKIYVGSSVNIQGRWGKHKSLLRHNKHENPKLQNAWNKYLEEDFSFNIIEECSVENLLEREQFYMDTLLFAQDYIKKLNTKFHDLAFNIVCLANTTIISKETREKIINSLKVLREQGLLVKTNTKKCFQYNRFTGELIKVWDVINDANRYYNTPNNTTSVIQRALWGDTPTAFNSVWSFEEINFIWARAPQKRDTLIVQNVIEKTYSFYDSVPIFLETIGLNSNSRVTITKCIKDGSLFKNRYFCFKIEAPVIYDRKPFELLGTREDLITKTEEEILNVNV